MKLKPGEHVVCAWAEPAAGPGWGNAPLWFIVRDGNGGLRQECLQPDEQPRLAVVLYSVSAIVSRDMKSAVAGAVESRQSKRRA